MLYVAHGRSRAPLDGYFTVVGEATCGRLQTVAMDMRRLYSRSVPEPAEALIAFAKFYVTQHPESRRARPIFGYRATHTSIRPPHPSIPPLPLTILRSRTL